MKTTSLLVGLAFLLSVCAVAQEEIPKGELYLGYSYMRIAPTSQVNAYNSNGGVGQIQYNINKHIGILADLGGFANGNISVRGSGNLPQNQTQFMYLFGPRIFTNKAGKVSPFVELEVGGIHNSRSFNFPAAVLPVGFVPPRGITVAPSGPGLVKFRSTQNGFGLAVGGGLDIKVKKSIAIRPIQLDYLPSKFSPFNVSTVFLPPGVKNNTQWANNIRYTGGVTFRFGGGSQ